MEFPGIYIFRYPVLWDYMDIRLPDMGMFACHMTQARHGVCYLSRSLAATLRSQINGWGLLSQLQNPSSQLRYQYFIGLGRVAARLPTQSIPHALFESSGMQSFPYPAIGYLYFSKIGNLKNPYSRVSLLPAQWPNVLMGPL